MQVPERASSAYTARNARSTLTMMKYLTRTSSEGELNKVLHQQAKVEGTVAERRKREGKLRNEQEAAEQRMTTQMQSLATTLQADAHAKAAAKARAAAAARQANVAAEHAARAMGAVAPHRAAARDAALAVVAPKDSFAGGGLGAGADRGEPGSPGGGQLDVSAHPSVLLAEHSASAPVRPGKYCLRAAAQLPGASAGEALYLTYAGGGNGGGPAKLAAGSADVAAMAPWTVRQPAGARTCTLATSGGAKLYATAAGVLSVGEPPRSDLAQFIPIPHASGSVDVPSPRPFSSAPRHSGTTPASAAASPRPQTAVPPSSSIAAGAGSGAPLLVRLFHPPSRRFLHLDAASGVASVQLGTAPDGVAASSPRAAGRHALAAPSQPGLVFEMQQQQQSPQQQSSRGPASRASVAAPARTTRAQAATTLPLRGFDMATGSVRGRAQELRPEYIAPRAPVSSLLFEPPPPPLSPPAAGELAARSAAEAARAPSGGSADGGNGAPVGFGRAAEPSFSSRRTAPRQVDDTRKTAWEASHLDLSDVVSQGPFSLRSLFAAGPTGAPAAIGGAPLPARGACDGYATRPLRFTPPPTGVVHAAPVKLAPMRRGMGADVPTLQQPPRRQARFQTTPITGQR